MSGPVALLLAGVLWGMSPVSTRFLVLLVGPRETALLRLCLSACAYGGLLLAMRRRLRLNRHDLWLLVAGGLLGVTVYQAVASYGALRVSGGVAALLSGTEPVFIAALSVFFLRERPSPRTLAGVGLSLVGCAVLSLARDNGHRLDAIGLILLLVAHMGWSAYNVIAKPLLARHAVLPFTAWVYLVGTAGFLPLAWAPPPLQWVPPGVPGWVAAFILGVGCSFSAGALWTVGLAKVDAASAGVFLYLIPVFGFIGSILFLGEHPDPLAVAAGLLIIGGVWLAQSRTSAAVPAELP